MSLLSGPKEDLTGYIPDFGFELYDLHRFADDQIKGTIVSRVVLLLLKHIRDPDLRQKLVKEGRTLEADEQNLGELNEQARTFGEKQVPVLRALGVDMIVKPHKPAGSELGCPSYLFFLPEIIDNSSTIHYSRPHYGNEDFNTFGLCSVAVKGQKSSL